MVSTRSHPSTFPPAHGSPSKAVSRSAPSTQRPGSWTHRPTPVALLWLLISLPLVFWDMGYVFLRPASMPGGSLHNPIWKPYALYGTVDFMYGDKAWNEHNGFTAAQSLLNLAESAGYVAYLWVVWRFGQGEKRVVPGGWGGIACLVGFAVSVMTVSKTVLYCECLNLLSLSHQSHLGYPFRLVLPNGKNLFYIVQTLC